MSSNSQWAPWIAGAGQISPTHLARQYPQGETYADQPMGEIGTRQQYAQPRIVIVNGAGAVGIRPRNTRTGTAAPRTGTAARRTGTAARRTGTATRRNCPEGQEWSADKGMCLDPNAAAASGKGGEEEERDTGPSATDYIDSIGGQATALLRTGLDYDIAQRRLALDEAREQREAQRQRDADAAARGDREALARTRQADEDQRRDDTERADLDRGSPPFPFPPPADRPAWVVPAAVGGAAVLLAVIYLVAKKS
jgi:hypothetical protein